MQKATEKQINYLKKLGSSLNDEELKNLTIKEASILIYKLKNNQPITTTKKETSKNDKLDLSKIDFESLYKKYNAYTVDTTNSNYNDINGVNKNSELLNDSRKFKSFISNLLKTEFKGLKFKIECSFRRYYNSYCDITLYIEDPFIDYKEAETKFNIYSISYLLNNYSYLFNLKDTETTKEEIKKFYYNNYFKVDGLTNTNHSKHIAMQYFLKEDVKKLYDFLNALLDSYSYDHNDIMTDYFSYGMQGGISIYDLKYNEEEINSAYNKAKNTSIEDIYKLGALTDEEKLYIEEKTKEYINRINAEIEEEKRRKEQQLIN